MKKIVLICLILAFVWVCVWLFLKKSTPLSYASAPLQETNLVIPVFNSASTVTASRPASLISTDNLINALAAINLEQWKAIIPGLHKSPGFKISEYWDMWQTNLISGTPVQLEQNGKAISYKAQFVDISVKNGTDVRRVEMHSPVMNIDETRELGLQLCAMLGVDSKEFLAWCGKVGNRWMDQPLYATGKGAYGFQILRTFNDEKPWFINFIIQNP